MRLSIAVLEDELKNEGLFFLEKAGQKICCL